MRISKLEKCASSLNDAFTTHLAIQFKERFDRELESNFNIFSMELVSKPVDGGEFTKEQYEWVKTWSDGYGKALDVVRLLALEGGPK